MLSYVRTYLMYGTSQVDGVTLFVSLPVWWVQCVHRSMCMIVVWALKEAGSLSHAGMQACTIHFIVHCTKFAAQCHYSNTNS